MTSTSSGTVDTSADCLYSLATELFPICRSITGEGVRQTLKVLQKHIPELIIRSIPSGTRCFDWTVPPEWAVRGAYILDASGTKIVDFSENNLHLVGYSTPVNREMDLAELDGHLYSLPNQPDAIPYVTSYYEPRWGFCLAHNQRTQMKSGRYQVVVDTSLEPGVLNYGELIIPGSDTREVLLSTYICHPSMGNNETSGPVVTAFLAKWLGQSVTRRYTYRIVFLPETIGPIVYLSRHLEEMKRNTVAGFVITCVGDDLSYSYLPSRDENTLSDRVAIHVLRSKVAAFKRFSFLDRGSDERQYCSPGVDLPIASVMRSKYHTYPEYHTSLDNLSFISPKGLWGAYEVLRNCLVAIERNRSYRTTVLCEPQLGRRGLYSNISKTGSASAGGVRLMVNLLAYADGHRDLIDIAEVLNVSVDDLYSHVDRLTEAGLLAEA